MDGRRHGRPKRGRAPNHAIIVKPKQGRQPAEAPVAVCVHLQFKDDAPRGGEQEVGQARPVRRHDKPCSTEQGRLPPGRQILKRAPATIPRAFQGTDHCGLIRQPARPSAFPRDVEALGKKLRWLSGKGGAETSARPCRAGMGDSKPGHARWKAAAKGIPRGRAQFGATIVTGRARAAAAACCTSGMRRRCASPNSSVLRLGNQIWRHSRQPADAVHQWRESSWVRRSPAPTHVCRPAAGPAPAGGGCHPRPAGSRAGPDRCAPTSRQLPAHPRRQSRPLNGRWHRCNANTFGVAET